MYPSGRSNAYGKPSHPSQSSYGQNVSALNANGSGQPAMERRNNFGSITADSPKYATAHYVSPSSHGHGHKSERLIREEIDDYPSLERRQYAERQGTPYPGRELPAEPVGRYADPVAYSSQRRSELYDPLDPVLRQEQMMKSQSLQPSLQEGARFTMSNLPNDTINLRSFLE